MMLLLHVQKQAGQNSIPHHFIKTTPENEDVENTYCRRALIAEQDATYQKSV